MKTIVEDDNIRTPPSYREDGPPQVVTADTARQGPSGRRILIVLLASLLAVVVGWLAVETFYGFW